VGFSVAVSDRRRATDRNIDVKELQRRAFERGSTVEREAWTGRLDRLLATLEGQVERQNTHYEDAREEIIAFAVGLAMAATERLLGCVVGADNHDPRSIVDNILGEIEAGGGRGSVQIHMHPDDYRRVGTSADDRPLDGAMQVQLVSDPSLSRGNFQTHGDEVSHFATLSKRLQAMTDVLIQQGKSS
jgi:flagellar biosynthesis/type III secretory pathway protein FliH